MNNADLVGTRVRQFSAAVLNDYFDAHFMGGLGSSVAMRATQKLNRMQGIYAQVHKCAGAKVITGQTLAWAPQIMAFIGVLLGDI